jgi:hypothetical protein
MPTATRPPRNGAAASLPPRPRRWLLSAPVPLPNLGDYATLIAIYDLDAVMSFDWGALTLDLAQADRALQRQHKDALAAHVAAWPEDARTADPDGWFAADHAAWQGLRALAAERAALNRAMNLRALGLLIVEVQGLEGVEVADPTDPAAWEGWSDHMLEWLTSKGRQAAQEQLTGPKSPPATATPSR